MKILEHFSKLLSKPLPAAMVAAECPMEHAETGPRLNLGCGKDYREGYINVDLNSAHRVDLLCDVSNLAGIADQSCCEVLAQDVLEHLPRAKGGTCLLEWNRVLKPDGLLRLRLPSVVDLVKLMEQPDRQSVEQQQAIIQCLYGTQGYEGDFHLNGYTRITLEHALESAGFRVVALELFDEWLFDVEARKSSHEQPDPMLRVEGDEAFVRAAYQALFGRDVDPGGLQYYTTVLGRGIARESVLESLKSSAEYSA